MATGYYQGKFGFSEYKKINPGFSKVENIFLKQSKYIFVEVTDGKIQKKPKIKVISDGARKWMDEWFEVLKKTKGVELLKVKPGAEYTVKIGTGEFVIYKSGGRLTNITNEEGISETAKTPTAAQQEDAVVLLLSENKILTPAEIDKNLKFNFSKDWHNSFQRAFEAISSKLKLSDYDFYRDSNAKKAKMLNLMTDSKILPDSKDNWNPSDVWAVKKTAASKLEKEIAEIHSGIIKGTMTIGDMNKFLEDQFEAKTLIGISLKQVTGSKAKIDKITVDFDALNKTTLKFSSKKFKFSCSNSYFDTFLDIKYMGKDLDYYFRYRPKAKSGDIKIYGEGRAIGADAFDGAISSTLMNTKNPQLIEFTKWIISTDVMMNVDSTMMAIPEKYKEFANYYKNKKFKTIDIFEQDKTMTEYEVKRAVTLLFYVFTIEQMSEKDIRALFFAAKKLNTFSSIHYKVS